MVKDSGVAVRPDSVAVEFDDERQTDLELHDAENVRPLGLVGEALSEEALCLLAANEELDDVAE